MKHTRYWISAVLAAVLLASCGGDDPYVPGQGQPSGAPTTKGSFTSLVVFGDSLSDVGAYAPATAITALPGSYLGGKWTTNTVWNSTTPNGAKIWLERLAETLQAQGMPVPVPTPDEVGWGTQSVRCPAELINAAYAVTCTAYGQGGSMVTDPNGYNHANGPLTVPIKTQIQRHLDKPAVGGKFKDSDLIVVWGGGNELFTHFATFAAQVGAIFATPGLSADQIKAAVLDAELTALGKVKTAALEEASYVKDMILAKGGKYVVVVNVPDMLDSPYGAGLAANPATAPVASILSALPDNFNFWLREGLTGQPVQIVDAWTLVKQVKANPSAYGIVNMTKPTCNFAKQDAILGVSLESGRAMFCNVTTGTPFDMKDPVADPGVDPDTWFFADDVHPSSGGNRVLATEFAKSLKAYGWIN
jgi:outer membrane lipase/esterase